MYHLGLNWYYLLLNWYNEKDLSARMWAVIYLFKVAQDFGVFFAWFGFGLAFYVLLVWGLPLLLDAAELDSY